MKIYVDGSAHPNPGPGGFGVVVVDDDQIVAISLKTILEADAEIEVVACGNDGEDAVELYEKEKPDILLMDIQMKKKSGLSAAEEIMKKNPDAKILLLTTFSDDEDIIFNDLLILF